MTSSMTLLSLIVMSSVHLSVSMDQGQALCPFNSNCTIRGYDSRFVYKMQCNQLGDVNQVPDTCSSQLIVRDLVLGPQSTVINSLQARILPGFRVINLVLTGLGIESVDLDAFTTLGMDLMSLALNSNRLTTLPEGLFKSTTMLSRLQLQNNALTTINPRVFEGLTNLAYLDLSGNSIGEIVPGAWVSTPQLIVLRLSSNFISGGLNSSMVSGLSSLEELTVDGNNLDSVDAETFKGLGNLVTLNASRNNIRSLPSNVFIANVRLETVDFSSNNITKLENEVFNGTKTMTTLLLNDNAITELAIYVFRDMNNLRVIDLHNNLISSAPSNSLSGLASARELDLSNNQISSLPIGIFDPLGLVGKMSLRNNRISVVDQRPFQSMKDLVTLDLGGNRIHKLTADWFQTTGKLSIVMLDNNDISMIETGTFANIPSLTELDLSGNQLTNVDGMFANLSTLTSLNLAHNPLRGLPEAGSKTLVGLTSLGRLNLSSTCLTNVSFSSAVFSNLEELDLHDNGLRELPVNLFISLSSLRRLDLGSNDLQTIQPGTVSPLNNLEQLNLTGNFLSSPATLSSVLSELTSGPLVDLSWNYLTSVGDLPSTLGGVYLHGNPILCSCDTPTWMTSNPVVFRDADTTSCLLAENNTAELMFCHWAECSPSVVLPVGMSCSIPFSVDTSYLLGQRRPPFSCPWDTQVPTTVTPPRLGFVDVESNSPTSVIVRWNLTDSSTPGVRVVVISGNATIDLSTNTTGNSNVVESRDINDTECVINDLTSGRSYQVCVGILNAAGEYTSYVCEMTSLPFPVLPLFEVQMSAAATDSSIQASWSVISGTVSTVEYFRLTWKTTGSDQLETVWLSADNLTHTIANLSDETEYQVCIQAIARPGSEVVNSTICRSVSTLFRPSTPAVPPTTTPANNSNMIIIIAVIVSVGVLLLLILFIVIIIVCCRRRRKTHDPEAAGHVTKVPPTSLQPSDSMKSTRSVTTGRLAEHGEVSLSIYDDAE